MPDQKPEPIPYATPAPRDGWRGWLSRRAATSGQRMIALVAMTWMGFQLCTPSRWIDLPNLGWWIIYVAVILFAVEFLLSFFHWAMPDQKQTLEYATPIKRGAALDDEHRHDTAWTIAAVCGMIAIAFLAIFGRVFFRWFFARFCGQDTD
jgi:hypothetical protein